MKLAAVVLLLVLAGCATRAPEPAPAKSLVEQADARMAAEDYGGAQALYADFVKANPEHAQATRARATGSALERLRASQAELLASRAELLASQAELERAQRAAEAPRLRRELAERQAEVERLKAEMAKLRADIERLRSIDLNDLRRERRKR